MKNKKITALLLATLMVLTLALTGCDSAPVNNESTTAEAVADSSANSFGDIDNIPEFKGEPYIVINDNVPELSPDQADRTYFENYAPLDSLGRCGVAFACLGLETMPTEDRGEIGQVKPSGWKTAKYDCVDGKYLFNRCHLVGFQLSGENANERNLITGTRYMNVQGMLPFENMVADYIKETGNHVLYRVTPIFKGDELVARGVQMEAFSVEDEGEGICFNVFCYNNQPGVKVNYATGDSEAFDNDPALNYGNDTSGEKCDYVLNTNSKKIHLPDCSSAKSMSDKNREEYFGTKDELLDKGYTECSQCNP